MENFKIDYSSHCCGVSPYQKLSLWSGAQKNQSATYIFNQ